MSTHGWQRFALTAVISIAAGLLVLEAADVLAQLGLTEREARQHFHDSLNAGYLAYTTDMAKAFKALPPAARRALVSDGMAWAKAYVSSPAFQSAYADARQKSKPAAPAVVSVDDEIKKQRDDQLKQINDMKKSFAALPPDQRQTMDEVVKQAIAAMEAMDKDPALRAAARQALEASQMDAQNQYESQLKQWQEDHPADPSALMARRLRAFLAATAEVEFTAKLVSRDGRMYFVDEQYQQKPNEWKFCYRAGRDAVTAARAAASLWLSELGK